MVPLIISPLVNEMSHIWLQVEKQSVELKLFNRFVFWSNRTFLYSKLNVKYAVSFLVSIVGALGGRGHRAQDRGRNGQETTLDCKGFPFPKDTLPLSVSMAPVCSLPPTLPSSSTTHLSLSAYHSIHLSPTCSASPLSPLYSVGPF